MSFQSKEAQPMSSRSTLLTRDDSSNSLCLGDSGLIFELLDDEVEDDDDLMYSRDSLSDCINDDSFDSLPSTSSSTTCVAVDPNENDTTMMSLAEHIGNRKSTTKSATTNVTSNYSWKNPIDKKEKLTINNSNSYIGGKSMKIVDANQSKLSSKVKH
jgi:hypothetical protein